MQVEPPDLLAAETVLEVMTDRGTKPDAACYGSFMRGLWTAKQTDRHVDMPRPRHRGP